MVNMQEFEQNIEAICRRAQRFSRNVRKKRLIKVFEKPGLFLNAAHSFKKAQKELAVLCRNQKIQVLSSPAFNLISFCNFQNLYQQQAMKQIGNQVGECLNRQLPETKRSQNA